MIKNERLDIFSNDNENTFIKDLSIMSISDLFYLDLYSKVFESIKHVIIQISNFNEDVNHMIQNINTNMNESDIELLLKEIEKYESNKAELLNFLKIKKIIIESMKKSIDNILKIVDHSN